ncbi:hypothetical protein [Mycoplasma phocimorsus]|uniref:hypothetical protein n=1 Tax=Mycoplasma phocimorsus TaxID=3045839 RepID=UPI0024C02241|nr:hypothetical protein [Mycoplasma phocimorsus]MDJ1646871.1 hypothetical protein [Mycoplasma phocimorsus]
MSDVKVKKTYINDGITTLYEIIKRLNIFNLPPKIKHKNLEALLEYQIASRVLNENNVLKRFETKNKYKNNITSKKTTFYNLLDILADNENIILKG